VKLQSATQILVAVLVCAAFASPAGQAQQQAGMDNTVRGEVSDMLHCAYEEVNKHYYDPKLQGIDWDARYRQFSERIANAPNLGEGFRVVAAFLSGLKDSHTFFVPPSRAVRYDSGYRYTLVGNDAFITQVRPNTDAATKLHIGDKILGMGGFIVDRRDYQEVQYYFNALSPQMSMKFDLRSPSGETRQVVVAATAKPIRKVMDLTEGQDYYELIRREENEDHATRSQVVVQGDLAIWRLQQFFPDGSQLAIDQIERAIGIARKHKALILDLRGNPGGDEEMLRLMAGSLFDHEIKIGDRVGRKEKDSKPLKSLRHGQPFDGKLIVLVDSESASCSELLARLIQLEHRGTVIGDQSAGAVMEARYYSESMGAETKMFFGVQVTSANLIMSDGKSLEKTGVTPDELLVPTAADLAAGRDPVLAHAVELAGGKLDAEAAGKLFPFEWLKI
jgi:C-terminal processing protease CtpA/Prc